MAAPQDRTKAGKGKGTPRFPSGWSKGGGKSKGHGDTQRGKGKSKGKSSVPWTQRSQKGAMGRQPSGNAPPKAPTTSKLTRLVEQNKKMREELLKIRGTQPVQNKAPKAHEVYTTFEGDRVSLYSLTRMLEVEESERGYKGHARYAQIQAAIQVCRRKRDAILVPTERRQKMERIIASLQTKKDNQMQEKERLDAEQKELDARKRANGSELQKIDDELASAQSELNRIQPDGSVWKGSSKGRKSEAAPASPTWHIAEDDDENDVEEVYQRDDAWAAEYDDWDRECDTEDSPVSDVEFNNWLQTRHPDIYDTVTVYFDWEPPSGMLDRHYSNYATEKANAEALREAIKAQARGESKERWQKWINKHLGFFLDKQQSAMPQDIRSAYEDGTIAMAVGEQEEAEGNAAKRPRQRSNSNEQQTMDDDEDKGLPWVVDGPYLEPEPDGKLYHILAMDEQYAHTMEAEESREQFQAKTGQSVPSATEAGTTNQKKRTLLHKYLYAIHTYKDQWDRFPELETYYQMVETKTKVLVDDTA